MSLCLQCEEVVQTVIKWDSAPGYIRFGGTRKDGELVELEHHTDVSTFREALNSGCWMCNLAWKTDHAHTNENTIPDHVPKVFGSTYIDGGQLEFRARAERVLFFLRARVELPSLDDDDSEDEMRNDMRREWEAECAHDTGQCPKCLYGGFHGEPYDKSQSLKKASEWLEDCRLNHPDCWNEKETKQYFRTPQHPSAPQGVSFRVLTRDELGDALGHDNCSCHRPGPVYRGRLIDLGHETLSPDQWRLIEVGGSGIEHYTYTTLSHRWASYEPLMLNATTRAQMSRGMPISVLPANYQDAVRITKALGVRYLWIDTLCVFQDNDLDIQEAACNMAVVYSGSVCNIAMMTNRSDGILNERASACSPDAITYCRFQAKSRKCYRIWHDSVWHREVATMPLYKRGWIAQEQILPGRQLLCGSRRLFWSCRKLTKYQTSSDNVWKQNSSQGWANQMRLARMLDPGTEWHSDGTYWFTFINQYTQRDLTNAQDKLLAVSGIARFLQSKTQGLYMAGLWESALPDSLLWQAARPASTPGFPTAYRAPSWSWASVDGTVSYTPPELPIARYLDSWVRTKNDSNFGLVTPEAFMILCGPVFSLAHNDSSGNDCFKLVGYEDYPITVELDHRPKFHEMLPEYHLIVMDVELNHIGYGFRGLLLQKVKPSQLLKENFHDLRFSLSKVPTLPRGPNWRSLPGPDMYERIGLVRASTTREFAHDGSLVERGGPGLRTFRKTTAFGSMLNTARKLALPEDDTQSDDLDIFANGQLYSYEREVVIM